MAETTTKSDEQKLVDLLTRRRELGDGNTPEARELEREIVELIYQQLHDALRPAFLARYGALVGEQQASTRFTELLNGFFTRVLKRFPRGMVRAETLQNISDYASISMANLIKDHFRKSGRVTSCDETFLGCLIEERQQALAKACPDVLYEQAVDVLNDWEASGDTRKQLWAKLIRYRFIMGTSQARTQWGLGVNKDRYYILQREALESLRREVLQ